MMSGKQLHQQRKRRPAHRVRKRLFWEFSVKVLGNDGLRNRYLEQAEAGRGTLDVTGPITSIEQSQMLKSGRLLLDRDNGASDGDSSFKSRPDP
jgi:conjugal transfer mating pair stabilization protein TraG